MAETTHDENRPSKALRKQGEEAIGRFAQDFLQNPVVTGALSTVFETRERATRAQEVAMSALNLPSAADLERLTRRVRSVAQRLEGLEDGLDRLGDKLDDGASAKLEPRLSSIEATLESRVAALEEKLDAALKPLEEKLDARIDALVATLARIEGQVSAEKAPADDA